ncbi:MAG: CHASE3 domain-containing protein, partial [Mucilaginibacter polytrichastri]|nr:CHASE3 domain-containing protein [Mucilaginibacter polytrichastri]
MFKFSFRKQILIGFAVTFLLVAGISFYSYKCIISLEDDKFKVEHTQRVIDGTHKLIKDLLDAETGQRGFVITGNAKFLEPYNASVGNVRPTIDSLNLLMADNRSQEENLDSLDYFADKKLHYMADVISLYQAKGFDTARAVVNTGVGKLYMDRCRFFIDRIVSQENQLLSQRKIRSVQSIYSSIQAITIGGILFTAVIGILFYVIQNFFVRQNQYQRQMVESNLELERVLGENESKNWILTGIGRLNEITQGDQNEEEMVKQMVRAVGKYTHASFGTFYLYSEISSNLNYIAGYAIADADRVRKVIDVTESWLGQAVAEGKVIELEGPANQNIQFETSVLAGEIYKTYIVPFFFRKKLIGVMELAYLRPETAVKNLLEQISLISGESIHTAQSRTILQQLFEQTQQQAAELEAQQEELRTTNEELVYKTEMLQASEEELRVQQDELQITNGELALKAGELEERNQAIEEARADIAQKMQELENTGRYKSEFLANMSHELRTPLNSILVLARILKDNQKQNLNTDQVKYADVILRAGTDLLTLINDILDLTKIESGKIELEIDEVDLNAVALDMENLFTEIAGKKSIQFRTSMGDGVSAIRTDRLRVEQVVKNLLSNAFKFTDDGGEIDLSFRKNGEWLEISVKDNGIGIPADKQKLIFEAFQQADGSTSRKYGGTGLGLSISRELATFLGGKISITSEVGE